MLESVSGGTGDGGTRPIIEVVHVVAQEVGVLVWRHIGKLIQHVPAKPDVEHKPLAPEVPAHVPRILRPSIAP